MNKIWGSPVTQGVVFLSGTHCGSFNACHPVPCRDTRLQPRALPSVEEEGAREGTSSCVPSVALPVSMLLPSSQVPGTVSGLFLCYDDTTHSAAAFDSNFCSKMKEHFSGL